MSRKMTRRTFATLAVGVPGVAVLYACTPGEPAPPSPTANVAFTQRQTSGESTTGGAATAAPAEAANPALPPVAVEGGDLYFNPTQFTAEPGQTVALTNVGALPHNFAIEGYNDASPVDMPNGETANWVVPSDLAPGDHVFYCEIPGHREAGMVGNVTIVAAGTTPAAGAAAAPAAPPVPLEAGDLFFNPTTLNVEQGQTIQLTNNGALPHNFAITGYNDAEPVDMPNGQTVEWVVPSDLAPNTYEFYCEIPGHKEAGMVGSITVAAAGSAPAAAPESGGTPASGTPESGTPVATTGATPAAPVAPAAPAAVSVSMVDLAFEPADMTIPANTDVPVTVTNNGVLQHNWDVLGTAFKTNVAGGGDVQTLTVNLAAGSYDFQCDVPGHAQAGMVGKLTVQ